MKNNIWNCIGVMSGTSLDGVDIAYISFTSTTVIDYKILKTVTIPYPISWKKKLTDAFTQNHQSKEIKKLNIEYGSYLGNLINFFTKENNIENIDFIASHGHTIFHNPKEGYTLQIGDGQTIANTCKQKVVCDFRTQDVALGGQGAPLVPIGDKLLFSEYDYCINIGGFANISYEDNTSRIAYDICPANIVLNYFTRKIGLEYDNNGKLARTGEIHTELLIALDNLSFYKTKNSMGNEQVATDIIPLIESCKLETKDILNTYIEHIAQKIGKDLKPNTTALITGGGAYNNYLIERIKKYTKSTLIIPDNTLIDYKESLIFGLLGLLKIKGKINVLASVTNAKNNHSSGRIFKYLNK